MRFRRFSVLGFRFSLVCLLSLSLLSCATPSSRQSSTSPGAVLGTQLTIDASQILQAYIDYKAGNANMAWALAMGLEAEKNGIKTVEDFKAVVRAWTGNTGDSQKLADRLARIFGTGAADPAAKTAAIASITRAVADNGGP